METKILLKWYLPALMGFLVYFVTALWQGWVFDEKGSIEIAKLIFHCIVLVLTFPGVSFGISVEITV
jgi:hypothetical protein